MVHLKKLKSLYASYSKFPKELKNEIEILLGQAVFKLWIKTVIRVDNFEMEHKNAIILG